MDPALMADIITVFKSTAVRFLDSLDECILHIGHVGAMIADQLLHEPVERLRIRVACRSVPWPEALEESFKRLFGDGFAPYELMPLRRKDVRQAAERSGIADPDAFLARVDELGVSSLAIKPVSLRLLINLYLRDKDLPSNQTDLYEKGCRVLCESERGMLSIDQRYAIASRIAAVTHFTNRFAVWTGSADGGSDRSDYAGRETRAATICHPAE
jgi:predicted NACHT family NTPase